MVEDFKLVYVIIPIYNVAKYLRRCLDSLLNQTYKNYLVICVNDGSTDNSLSILKEYKDKFKNKMVIIDKPNGGPSSARNAGLDYITDWDNSYITFVDSDDWVSEDYLAAHLDIMKNNNVDIVASNYFKNNKIIGNLKKDKILNHYYSIVTILRDVEINSNSPHKLYKTMLWKDIRYPTNIITFEDVATIFKVFYKAQKTYVSTYCGYYYFTNPFSIMLTRFSNKQALDTLEALYLRYVFKYDFKNIKTISKINKSHFFHTFIANIQKLVNPLIDGDIILLKKYYSLIKEKHFAFSYHPKSFRMFIRKYIFMFSPNLYIKIFNKNGLDLKL